MRAGLGSVIVSVCTHEEGAYREMGAWDGEGGRGRGSDRTREYQ